MNNNVKELRELLLFVFTIHKAIAEVLEDKKVKIWEVFKFSQVLPTIEPAFEDLGNPVDRYNSLTAEEKQELYQSLRQYFDIPNDELETLVESSIANAAELVSLGSRWAKFAKKKK